LSVHGTITENGFYIDLGVANVRILLLFLALTTSVFAQQASITSLIGRVTDSNGATVPGATVKAVEDATHETYSGTTNEGGLYFFQFVKIGTYTITATANGFATVMRTGVVVEVNQLVRTNF
jgi:hypothetical protein